MLEWTIKMSNHQIDFREYDSELKEVIFNLKKLSDKYKDATDESVKMFRMNILSATLFLASISNARPEIEIRKSLRNKVAHHLGKIADIIKEKKKAKMHIKMAVSDLDTWNLLHSNSFRAIVVNTHTWFEASIDTILVDNQIDIKCSYNKNNMSVLKRLSTQYQLSEDENYIKLESYFNSMLPSFMDKVNGILKIANPNNKSDLREHFDALRVLRNKCSHPDVRLSESEKNSLRAVNIQLHNDEEPTISIKNIYVMNYNCLNFLNNACQFLKESK